MAMIYDYPKELTMFEVFGVEPKSSMSKDGYWEYVFSDENKVSLALSFNIFEGSIQTALSLNGTIVETVSHEGEGVLKVEKFNNASAIRGELETAGIRTTIAIKVSPLISVNWSSIIVNQIARTRTG